MQLIHEQSIDNFAHQLIKIDLIELYKKGELFVFLNNLNKYLAMSTMLRQNSTAEEAIGHIEGIFSLKDSMQLKIQTAQEEGKTIQTEELDELALVVLAALHTLQKTTAKIH